MDNPWKKIKAKEYEGHMIFIKQYELLNRIFKEQLSEHHSKTIGILGIGCGNGLEHIAPNTIVYGYDINEDFLNSCHKHCIEKDFKFLSNKVDLSDRKVTIHPCDLLICNLVLEYIGLHNFIRIVNKSHPESISVVLQITVDKEKAISDSPYFNTLRNLSLIRTEVYPQELTTLLDIIGYKLTRCMTYEIDQYKKFIRMNYHCYNTNEI